MFSLGQKTKKITTLLLCLSFIIIATCFSFYFYSGNNKNTARATDNYTVEDFFEFENSIKDLCENDEYIANSEIASFSLSSTESSNDEIGFLDSSNKHNYPKFYLKRLIVIGKIEETYGAIKIIDGYKDYSILCYDTEEQTEYAYEQLAQDKNIKVIIDSIISINGYADNTYDYANWISWGDEAVDIGGINDYLSTNGTSQEIAVVVMDTGININHSLFTNHFIKENNRIVGYSYINTTISSSYSFADDHGHGSHVSGIIANYTPSNVKILPMKVMNSSGQGSFSILLTALERVNEIYSSQYNIACINLSLGGKFNSEVNDSLDIIFKNLRDKNILTVVAAGNDMLNVDNYMPANNENVITVSALKYDYFTNRYCFDHSYSNFGYAIDICAPGTSIVSAYHKNDPTYVFASGTSMATPHVSAAIALLCSDVKYWDGESSNYTANIIENRLYENAIDLGNAGWDKYYGNGMLNLKYFDVEKSLDVLQFENEEGELDISSYIEFVDSITLTIKPTDSSYKIYYTTNRTIPNAHTSNLYTSPITLTNSTYLNIIALKFINEEIVAVSNLYQVDLFNPNDSIETFFRISGSSIAEYTGHFKIVNIPNKLDEYDITSIQPRVFSDNLELESITLPNTCKAINHYAFSGCVNLKEVYMPNVHSIRAFAFENCRNLNYLDTLNVQTLGEKQENRDINGNVFINCSKLSSMYLPKVISMGESLFTNTSINKVVIGQKFTSYYGNPLNENIIVYGYNDSYAETFAGELGNSFIEIELLSIVNNLETERNIIQDSDQSLSLESSGFEEKYQWYKTETDIENGILLTNETSASLELDTSVIGTAKYFVKITDWDGAELYSNICTINIIEQDITYCAKRYSDGWVYYSSLIDAVNDCNATDTIVITEDCIIDERICINKNISITSDNYSTIKLGADFVSNPYDVFIINNGVLNLGNTSQSYEGLTLTDIYFDGSGYDVNHFINVQKNGKLFINSGAIIEKFRADRFIFNSGYCNISGGIIQKNTTWDTTNGVNYLLYNAAGGVLEINGNAKIINNTIDDIIHNASSAQFGACSLIIGGNCIISDNICSNVIDLSTEHSTFIMTGGLISNNICSSYAIWSIPESTNLIRIISGEISNNFTGVNYGDLTFGYASDQNLISCELGADAIIGIICIFDTKNAQTIKVISDLTNNNQLFNIKIMKPSLYCDYNGEYPVVMFDENVDVDLSKFSCASNEYCFVQGNTETTLQNLYLTNATSYTLTYDLNYNDLSLTQNYQQYSNIIQPTDPIRLGYIFKGWYNEQECSTEFSLTTMPANDVTVYAKWEHISFNITTSCSNNGSITPSGISKIYYGDDLEISIQPNEGCSIISIKVDDIELSLSQKEEIIANGKYVLTDIQNNHEIYIEFAINTYTITASAGTNGTITPNGINTYNYGESQNFVITANDGYLVERIIVDGVFLSGSTLTNAIKNGYTFANINADHIINVQFAVNNYVAKVVDSSNGNVSYYMTLESAINNAPTESSVFILKSCDITETIIISKVIWLEIESNSNITITKKLNDNIFKITDTGSLYLGLTLSDNYHTFTITGNNNNSYATSPIIYNEGTLYLYEGVIIENTNCLDAVIVNHNKMVMKGGTIKNNEGNAILNNGTLSLKYSVQISNNSGYGIYSNGTLKITDGSIKGNAEQDLIIDNSILDIGGSFIANKIKIDNNSYISVSSNLTIEEQLFVLDLSDYTCYQLDSANPLITFAEGLTIEKSKFSLFNRFYELKQGTHTTTINNLYVNELEAFYITYNLNYTNSTPITQKYLENDSIILPEDPQRGGYQFKGWYLESDCINSFSVTAMPANDLTTFAKWEINKYKITATSGQNGEITPSGDIQVEFGGSQTYNFVANEGYEVSEILIDGIALSSIELELARNNGYTFTTVNKAHTIHVEFDLKLYSITYELERYHQENIVQYYHMGETIILPETPFYDYYFYFGGWYDNIENNTLHEFSAMPAENILVHGLFILRHYYISATYNEYGTVSPIEKDIVFPDSAIFNLTPNDGYTILDIKVDGNSIANEELIKARATNTFTFYLSKYGYKLKDNSKSENHTVCFEFSPIPYTITFNQNYTGAENTTKEFPTGANIVLIDNPTRIGHTFKGWYNEQECLTEFTLTTMPAYDLTAYAKWEINTYTVTATAGPNGTISPSGDIQVEFGGSQTFVASANEGYQISKIIVDNIELSEDEFTNSTNHTYAFLNIDDNHTIEVYFSLKTYTILYNLNYEGAENLSQIYEYTSNIELPANPNRKGYSFDGWYNEQECLTEFTLTTMPAYDLTVYAKWEINTYTISATTNENGAITPNGITTKNYNENQLYTFAPNAGYHVSLIKVDGTDLTGSDFTNAIENGYKFKNIEDNHTIYVEFEINTYTITAESNSYGSISPKRTNIYNYGESQKFVIKANDGYHIALVKIDDNNLEESEFEEIAKNGYTFSNITENHTIYVEFEINTYTITATAGPNGNITPSGDIQVEFGGSQTFTFAPNTGHHISKIQVDNRDLSEDEFTNAIENGYEFKNIEDNHTIYVEFEINTYTITATSGQNGDITPSGDIQVEFGGSQTFTFVANEGYEVSEILIDGIALSSTALELAKNNGYTFTNINCDHSIYVKFEKSTFTLTYKMNYDCEDITQDFIFQANIVLIDNPTRIGHTFKGWYNEQECLTEFVLTTMPANNVTVYAKWEINTYTITATAGPNGTISPSGEISAEYGSNIKFTFTPNTGYHISLIKVDGTDLTGSDFTNSIENGYTFTNVNEIHNILVEFEINRYTITLSVEGDGEFYSEQELSNISHGDDRLFIIETDFDKYRVEIYINNYLTSTTNKELRIEKIDENIKIEVKFIKKSFFETKVGIITIISSCIGILLIAISIPIVKRIKRNRMYDKWAR